MKRVRVRWHTIETLDWEADFEIPDDVDRDEFLESLWDGDCSLLVDYEDDHDLTLGEFNRETDEVTPL